MRKHLSLRSIVLLGIAALLLIFVPTACKRDKATLTQDQANASSKVANIKKWWDERTIKSKEASGEALSRIPANVTIQRYWQSQFQNGTPRWTHARVFTIGTETIYEVPFQFPDNLVLMNDKPDAPRQDYITGKAGSNEAMKPSQTYLIVKERSGMPNVAEIMCVVLSNPYIQVLDSIGAVYPDIRINNVYPAPNNMGDFCGSVKFYDLNGVQLLEEGYNNGTIFDYIEYGRYNFPITPHPNLPTTRMYSVCTWTYVYQQVCSQDAGCTDWELIGVIFNGCETIDVPDSPPVILPGGGGGGTGGGGGSYPPPPVIQQNPPIPNADLCGNYKWTRVGEALYTQIRNLGMTVAPNNPGGGIPQTFTLGLTCVHVPKWFVSQGYDLTALVNDAFNAARRKLMQDVNAGFPVSAALLQPKFEQYFEHFFEFQPSGIRIYQSWGRVVVRNGCEGNIPVSQPKWCSPIE